MKYCYPHKSNSTADATAKIASLLRTGRETPNASAEIANIKRQIHDDIKEAKEILEQFELEVREIPKESKFSISKVVIELRFAAEDFFVKKTLGRQKYQSKLKAYQGEMKKVEGEFQSAMDTVQQIKSRHELIGATVAAEMYDDTENSALLESVDRIERGTRRLQEANRVAIESEQIGADILSNLQKDRETINRTRARVRYLARLVYFPIS